MVQSRRLAFAAPELALRLLPFAAMTADLNLLAAIVIDAL
jgi:hypothetical protein